nr:amphiregulin [Pogona vitticeps]
MRAALPLLLPLLWNTVCQHAAGSGLNVTEQKEDMPILKTPNAPAAEVFSSGVDYEEEDAKEVIAPQFLVGDPSRGELQLKKPEKSEGGKKNHSKPRRKGNKEKKNRKKNRPPCEGEFKNFCVHGECTYIENLETVSCKCYPDYFGERCVEQFLKTHKTNDAANYSTTILVTAAVVLSLVSFAAVVIIVIFQIRKKCPKYDEKEERKKLRQKNATTSNGV